MEYSCICLLMQSYWVWLRYTPRYRLLSDKIWIFLILEDKNKQHSQNVPIFPPFCAVIGIVKLRHFCQFDDYEMVSHHSCQFFIILLPSICSMAIWIWLIKPIYLDTHKQISYITSILKNGILTAANPGRVRNIGQQQEKKRDEEGTVAGTIPQGALSAISSVPFSVAGVPNPGKAATIPLTEKGCFRSWVLRLFLIQDRLTQWVLTRCAPP